MSYHITTSLLKSYGPGLRVRDESGNAKVVFFGGIKRVRIPSASIKYVVRRLLGGDEIKDASLGRFISQYVNSKVEKGKIDNDQSSLFAQKICTAIGCKYIALENGNDSEGKKKKGKKESSDANEKGNTVITLEAHTLEQICEGLYEYIAENMGNDKALEEKKIQQVANNIYESNPRAIAEALFGVMSTGGVVKTMYGAVKMSHMYSIDKYAGDRDFWIASHQSKPIEYSSEIPQDSKDFFDLLNEFTESEREKTNAETMGESDIYANTMYGNMTVDLRALLENLNEYSSSQNEKEENIKKAANATADVINTYIIANPEGNQSTQASYPQPEIVYIEIVENGNICTPEFSDVIRPGVKSVAEQGISRILSFSKDETFRTGTIKKYVILPKTREEFKQEFKSAGVEVVANIKDLSSIIVSEAERIIKEI